MPAGPNDLQAQTLKVGLHVLAWYEDGLVAEGIRKLISVSRFSLYFGYKSTIHRPINNKIR